MAVPLASAFIRLKPDLNKKEFERAGREAGESAGEELGEGITRGADAKLRDSRGKFVKSGQSVGASFGEGFNHSIAGGTFVKTLATMAARMTIVGSAAAAAAPGVLQLGAALAPAAGAAAVLPASLLAIKAASATVKIAVIGVSEAITAGFGDNAKEAAASLDKLSGSTRVFAKEVIRLKPQVTDLQKNISNRFFLPMADDVRLTGQKYMPILNVQMGNLAGSLGGLGEELLKTARNGQVMQGVNDLFLGTDIAVIRARAGIKPLALALSSLIQTTVPELPRIADGFVNISTKLSTFVQGAVDSGKVNEVFEEGIKTLKDLGGILYNVGSIFNSVMQSASNGSQGLLVNIRELTGQVAAFLNTGQGESALAAVFGVLAQLGQAMRTALGAVLPAIAESMAVLGPAIGGVVGPAAQLVVALAPLLPQAAGLAATIITALTPALSKVVGFLVENEQVIKGLLIAITAYNVAAKTMAIVTGIQAAGSIGKYIAATRIGIAVTRAWTVVQWALNASMLANPIGITIAIIAALIAIVVIAYKKNETFRQIVDKAWAGIKTAIAATVNWFTGTAWPALKKAWDAVSDAVMWLWRNAILPAWNGIRAAISTVISVVSTIIAGFGVALRKIGEVVTWLNEKIISPVFGVMRKVVEIWWIAVRIPLYALIRVLEVVIGAALGVLKAVWSAVFNTIRTILQGWWAIAQKIFGYFTDWISGPIRTSLISAREQFNTVFTAIRNTISTWWNTYVRPVFTAVKDAWNSVASSFSGVYNNNIRPLFERFGNFMKNDVVNAFRTAVKWIGEAWDKVKDAAKVPVAFVVNQVVNPFINGLNKAAGAVGIKDRVEPIKGFAGGGRIPGTLGYAQGGRIAGMPARTDNRQAMISGVGPVQLMGGEYVVNAKATRKALPLLDMINGGGYRKSARDGSNEPALADGGIVGWAKNVWGAVSNPGELIRKPFEALLSRVPGGGVVKDFLVGSSKRLLDGAVKWMTGFAGLGAGGAGGDWPASPGSQRGDSGIWRRIVAMIESFGLGQGSFGNGYRPGDPKWHGSGRALDWMGFNMDALATKLSQLNPLELIHRTRNRDYAYTRGQNKGSFNNALMEAHRNHIHIAMKKGGLLPDMVSKSSMVTPKLYDGGGRWPSGTIGYNRSGHTEHVLTGGPGGDMEELKALIREQNDLIRSLGGDMADALSSNTRQGVQKARQLSTTKGRRP